MDLTEREREILLHVAKGKTDKEIAKALGISVDTVKSHIRKICDKLGVDSRLEAVMMALAKGEIEFREVMSYWLSYAPKE